MPSFQRQRSPRPRRRRDPGRPRHDAVERGSTPVHVPAYGSDEVADVTGAGDTVIATFTLTLIAGGTLEDACRLSNYAAGLVVRKVGTATISPAELVEAVREDLGVDEDGA